MVKEAVCLHHIEWILVSWDISVVIRDLFKNLLQMANLRHLSLLVLPITNLNWIPRIIYM